MNRADRIIEYAHHILLVLAGTMYIANQCAEHWGEPSAASRSAAAEMEVNP